MSVQEVLYTHLPKMSRENLKSAEKILARKAKNHPAGWFFEYNYLYFLLRAASDFFLRFTLGFS